MGLFNITPDDPFGLRKAADFARDAIVQKALKRPEADGRKGALEFAQNAISKKQLKAQTINSATLTRLANTDPVIWAIRRTIKSHVSQAKWDIVIDVEDAEKELERFEDHALSHLSPYAIGDMDDFKSYILDPKLVAEIDSEIRHILQEPVSNSDKKKAIKWFFSSASRRIKGEAELHRQQVKQIFMAPSTQGQECNFRALNELVLEDLLIHDAGVVVKNWSQDGERLAELYHIPGDEILRYINEDRTIPEPPEAAYIWECDGIIRAEFDRDELVYIMQNPQKNGYGLSPLEVAAYVITASLHADEYNIDFFKHSNVPPGIINLGKDVTDDQRTLFQALWDNECQGKRGGLHRLLMTSGTEDLQFVPIRNMSNRDMQMMEYLKWTVMIKTTAYGLSPQDIGLTVDLHRTTAETQQIITQSRGIRSVLHLLEEYYNQEIVKKEYPFDDVKFQWQNIESTDEVKEANIDAIDIQQGVMSRNERRAKKGLRAIEGGDTVTVTGGAGMVAVSDLEEKEEDQEELEEQATGEDVPPQETPGEPGLEGGVSDPVTPDAGAEEDAGADPLGEEPQEQKLAFKVNRSIPISKQHDSIAAFVENIKKNGKDTEIHISFETDEEKEEK